MMINKLKLALLAGLFSFAVSSQETMIDLSLSGGGASPNSSLTDSGFADSGSYFNFSGIYYFSKFGIGLSLGQINFPTDNNYSDFTNNLAFPTVGDEENWSSFFAGIGPYYNFDFDKFEINLNLVFGSLSTKELALRTAYNFNQADLSRVIVVNEFTSDKVSTGFYSAGIRFGYKFSQSFGMFLTANYLSSFSDDYQIIGRTADFQDLDGDGIISEEDILKQIIGDISYSTSTVESKLASFNYGLGISYKIPRTKKDRIPSDNDTPNTPAETKVRKQMQDIKNVNQSDIVNPTGTIVFTNPVKERKKQERKLIQTAPENNSNFQELAELKAFTWRTVGERIMQPKYGVTVELLNGNQVVRTYSKTTSRESLDGNEMFEEEPPKGNYRWSVQEFSTGTNSGYSYFTFSNCEIDFSISNESIECLGYEGADRKYKICFDTTYSSSNGDLTYANPGSGLTVYDQTYAPLSPTLVAPNPTLVTQVGTTSSTVSYCFEVVVSSSVTAIGFGLQGDDLDPSPIVCQPGVSLLIDELPDCICDDCEEMELTFDNFNISMNAAGDQFDFNGTINVSVPIYGIEFNVQSYDYTATPGPCTEGVTSVETSGMILMPGTTINGSTSVQLQNETASGLPGSNDNASKFVKYESTTALTGGIPVNLTIGLPGPMAGFDPSCCSIEYTVCIKVRVFYDEGNCKSCVFTHCFNFNNQ